MKIYDVLILGAGASGLMCASHLDKKVSVAIVDVNDKVAKKLKISGGGKCNITNAEVSENNFDGEEELIEYVLSVFSRDDLLEFLDNNGDNSCNYCSGKKSDHLSDNPTEALVSLQNSKQTTYKTFVAVQNELTKAYFELRQNYSLSHFNTPFDKLF